jgi:hypothetical protein
MADLDLPPIFEERLVCRVIDQRVEECVLSFDVGEQRLGLVNSQMVISMLQINHVNKIIRIFLFNSVRIRMLAVYALRPSFVKLLPSPLSLCE